MTTYDNTPVQLSGFTLALLDPRDSYDLRSGSFSDPSPRIKRGISLTELRESHDPTRPNYVAISRGRN